MGHNLGDNWRAHVVMREDSGLQPGTFGPHGVLAMPGDISGGNNLGVGSVIGLLWVETRETLEHSVMHG